MIVTWDEHGLTPVDAFVADMPPATRLAAVGVDLGVVVTTTDHPGNLRSQTLALESLLAIAPGCRHVFVWPAPSLHLTKTLILRKS
ncbi:MAG: hypothetical protein WC997_02175 [Porticoccaceae bacterium]